MGSRREAGHSIVGPNEIIEVEDLRAEVLQGRTPFLLLPTDVFVFATGEAPIREVTKFGGLPYRPVGVPWPRDAAGRTLTFVAQICFTQSRDLVDSLPGDMLLVFAEDDYPDHDNGTLVLEWYPTGLTDLIAPDDVPGPAWQFFTGFGIAHRTVDYPNSESEFDQFSSAWQIATIEGTKIAGARSPIQPFEIEGELICAIGSINPLIEIPFPWLNRELPVAFRESLSRPDYCFNWGDAGSVFILRRPDGTIDWEFVCY